VRRLGRCGCITAADIDASKDEPRRPPMRKRTALVACLIAFSLASPLTAHALQPTTEIVSVSSSEKQGRQFSDEPQISDDGRYIVFQSLSANLATGDTNGTVDLFIRDRAEGTTRRITQGYDGSPANDLTRGVSMSSDGRYVAFISFASNLVPGDTNGQPDGFLWDRLGGIERISVTPTGGQIQAQTLYVSVSDDGRFVAFTANSDGVVPGDANDGATDVYVRDRSSSTTRIVSVMPDGQLGDGNSSQGLLSGDGHYVAFWTHAANLARLPEQDGRGHVVLHSLVTGSNRTVDVTTTGAVSIEAELCDISRTGRFVTIASYDPNLATPVLANPKAQIYLWDKQTRTLERVSVSSREVPANRIDGTHLGTVSDNGRYVSFVSTSTNLVPSDTNDEMDVFWRDRAAGVTRRVSLSSSGAQANEASSQAVISGSGQWVAFRSEASNLVSGDVNDRTDVFVRNLY
jgi:hypothetical protein